MEAILVSTAGEGWRQMRSQGCREMETGKREQERVRSRNKENPGRGGGCLLAQRDGETQMQSERATESSDEEGQKHTCRPRK